jgi:hypothetical protein
MKSTSMATNFPIFNTESRGIYVVIPKNLCEPTHIQKGIGYRLKMELSILIEWKSKQVGIHIQHLFNSLLGP